MQILAQSAQLLASPYLHLGYLAANPMMYRGAWLWFPGLGLLLLGTVLTGRLTRNGRPIATSRRAKLLGHICLIVGGICCIVPFFLGVRPMRPETSTWQRMLHLPYYLQDADNDKPPSIAQFQKKRLTQRQEFDASDKPQRIDRMFLDAWGRPIHLLRMGGTAGERLLLCSAGEDGTMGTEDDLWTPMKDYSRASPTLNEEDYKLHHGRPPGSYEDVTGPDP
jgi:hypothetical protein